MMLRVAGLIGCVVLALGVQAESLMVYTSKQSVKVASADGQTLLEFKPVVWGPDWSYTWVQGGFESQGDGGAVGAVGAMKMKMAKTEVPVALEVTLTPEDARTLKIEVSMLAEADTGLTKAVLSIKPGKALQGEGRTTIGEEVKALARGILSEGLERLAFRDESGGEFALEVAEPVYASAEANEGRLEFARDELIGGEAATMTMTMTFPEDVAFVLSAEATPMPENWGDWFAWKADSSTDEPSVIDLSDWLEKPAGKHGRVTGEADRLVYDGEPMKIWGVNTCFGFGSAPDNRTAERQAKFYAKYGINAVRFHKFGDGYGWQGILTERSFVAYDPEKLDKMDYFVHQLKENGIYTKLSAVFGAVRMGPDDLDRVPFSAEFGKPGKDGWITARQGATYFVPELQDMQIEQVVNILNHTNPHTGMRYADDPAVMCVEMVNENSVYFFWTLQILKQSETTRQHAGEQFFAWLKDKYSTEEALLQSWGNVYDAFKNEGLAGESWSQGLIYPGGNPWFYDPKNMGRLENRLLDTIAFLHDTQNKFYDRFEEAIRDTGYQGEITTSNWQAGRAFSHFSNLHSDARIGMIDRHNYFDGTGSMLAKPGGGMLSSGMQQVSHRPFMLSEWIHTFPNDYGVEGPAILGAYGMGLNGWDVSFIFQNRDQGRFSTELKETWDVVTPQILGVFPAVSRQVLRGDVKESDLTFVRKVHVPSLAQGKLGFDDVVEQGYDSKEFSSDVVPASTLAIGRGVVEFTDAFETTEKVDIAEHFRDGVIHSATDQLAWKPGDSAQDGYITLDTPGTQAVVGFAAGVTAELADVSITSGTDFAAVYVSATSADKTIANDPSLLITTIARVRNTGMKVLAGEMIGRGGPPLLIEPVVVELQLKRKGTPTVHILDHDGRRTGETVAVSGNKVTLDGVETQAVYYEVAYP